MESEIRQFAIPRTSRLQFGKETRQTVRHIFRVKAVNVNPDFRPKRLNTRSPSHAHQRPRNQEHVGTIQHRESEKFAGRRRKVGRLEPPAEKRRLGADVQDRS
jgi:hypothetical protein